MGNQLDTDLRADPAKFDFGGVYFEVVLPKGRQYTPAIPNDAGHYEISPGVPLVFRCNFRPFSQYKARIEVQRQHGGAAFIDQEMRDYVDAHVVYPLKHQAFADNGYREGVPFEVTVRIEADRHRKTIGGTFVIKD